ncbi:universal stress protein [Actinacidiphila acidipaludis]|uniref:Universal stress protein n=1 Tax=Actinacidiphila acidipaludis TaxID=2873382 RepID=A0ABS7Q3A1_9ACTN|nr:universal stress protein [Streptomyces acidipaludis]MBY8876254.1 universal stress protein [Streptomyces acidipaludis]
MVYSIVAGVDGSSASLAAVHWAAREALRRDTELLVVHATPARPGRTTLATPTDPRPRPAGKRWTPFHVADELRNAYPALSVVADEMSGQPLPALLEAARRAELLVLGAHGGRTAAGFLIGSVALGAAGRAPMPVVLVRPGTAPADEHFPPPDGGEEQGPYRDVVLGVNLAWPSERVVGFAFDAAARRTAALRVVHGWSTPESHQDTVPEDALPFGTAFDEAAVLGKVLAPWRDKFPGTNVIHEIVVGSADRHLLDAASDASLLVIGRRPRPTAIGPRSGSTTHTVLRHAQVPVAVVPSG